MIRNYRDLTRWEMEGHSPSAEGQTACHVAQLDGAD